MNALFRSSLTTSSSSVKLSSSSWGMSSTIRVCIFLHTKYSCCFDKHTHTHTRTDTNLIYPPVFCQFKVKCNNIKGFSLYLHIMRTLYLSGLHTLDTCTHTCMLHTRTWSSSASSCGPWPGVSSFSISVITFRFPFTSDSSFCSFSFWGKKLHNLAILNQ